VCLKTCFSHQGQDVPKFLKSMAARGPVYHHDSSGFSGKVRRSDRDLEQVIVHALYGILQSNFGLFLTLHALGRIVL
jgi:hypothetical protein